MLARSSFYPYQTRAVDFVKNNPNCAMWADCGLGKTASALTAFKDLRDAFEVDKALVIAPLRVARQVWSDEIDEWEHLQGLRVSRIVGTEKQRLEALRRPADVYTLNRENVRWLEELIIQGKKQVRPWPWDLVILDESTSFKSQSAQRWKSLRRLRRLFPRCIELTGTPVPNGYADLWAQIYLLDQGRRLGHSQTAFYERWFDPPPVWAPYTWTIRPESISQIQSAIADIVLTLRTEDYLKLPPVLFNPIKVQLDERMLAKYRELERRFIMETFSGRVVTAVNAAVCRGKLLQLANGSIYVGPHGSYEELHHYKVEALLELLEFLPTPVLIGYSFIADKPRLMAALSRFCGKGENFRVLEKDTDFDAFAAGQIAYGIAHPASAGHGLNKLYKSGAENAVWFGLTDNHEHWAQFNDRLAGGHRRVGRNVVIHTLIAQGTQDEGSYALLGRKGVTQEDLKKDLAALANRIRGE